MKNTGICPKCGSGRITRIPDNGKYANGNNIYTDRGVNRKRTVYKAVRFCT